MSRVGKRNPNAICNSIKIVSFVVRVSYTTKCLSTFRCNRVEGVACSIVFFEESLRFKLSTHLSYITAVVIDSPRDIRGLQLQVVFGKELQYLDFNGFHCFARRLNRLTGKKDIRVLIDYNDITILGSCDFGEKAKVVATYLYTNDCRSYLGRSQTVREKRPRKGALRGRPTPAMRPNDRARMYAPGMDNCIGGIDSYQPAKQRVAA